MSQVLDSKQAFKKGAVYDDGGGRPLPRAERPPAPTTEDRLVAVLAEIRAAVQLSSQLIAKLKVGDTVSYGEQIARQQEIILRILDEMKRAGNPSATDDQREVKRFDIERDDRGNMKAVIPIYGEP